MMNGDGTKDREIFARGHSRPPRLIRKTHINCEIVHYMMSLGMFIPLGEPLSRFNQKTANPLFDHSLTASSRQVWYSSSGYHTYTNFGHTEGNELVNELERRERQHGHRTRK